jgi:hypothetical protein
MLPTHIFGFPVILQIGKGLTITTELQTLVHPFTSVMVTEYVPGRVTVVQLKVDPLLHKYSAWPTIAQSSVEPPSQIVVFPEIKQLGEGLSEIKSEQMLKQPPKKVLVTE